MTIKELDDLVPTVKEAIELENEFIQKELDTKMNLAIETKINSFSSHELESVKNQMRQSLKGMDSLLKLYKQHQTQCIK
jgi:hypothetical protein